MTKITMSADALEVLPETKKEMLRVDWRNAGSHAHVRINYSSLDLIQTCMRKALYTLELGYRANMEAPATLFGRAIHKALEVWYTTPAAQRVTAHNTEDLQYAYLGAITQGLNPRALPLTGQCARASAVLAFLETASPLRALGDTDKRGLENGLRILNSYFDRYKGDNFEVVSDELGPMCERTASTELLTTSFLDHLGQRVHVTVELFGTVDMVLRDTQTGLTYICDHKTTSSLGVDFLNRLKPNWQYCGYTLLGKSALNLADPLFMVNGLQVAKTKTDFSRQFVNFDTSDFDELVDAIEHQTVRYLRALREFQDLRSERAFPMSAPYACTMWGGCEFRDVCIMKPAMRANALATLYTTKGREA